MKKVAILAGGIGKRMGGAEKGFIKIKGEISVKILLKELESFEVVIVCRDKTQGKLYKQLDNVTTIFDEFKGVGPLAGIHSALSYFKDNVAIIGVDMPLVKKEVVNAIFKEIEINDVHAVIPIWGDGKKEPLLACYSYKAVEDIGESLKKGERKIMNSLDPKKIKLYPIEKLRNFDRDLVSFLNINTLEDLKKVEELCS